MSVIFFCYIHLDIPKKYQLKDYPVLGNNTNVKFIQEEYMLAIQTYLLFNFIKQFFYYNFAINMLKRFFSRQSYLSWHLKMPRAVVKQQKQR